MLQNLSKYGHPLKLVAGGLALAAWFVGNELQRRELDEAVNKALDDRGVSRRENPNTSTVD